MATQIQRRLQQFRLRHATVDHHCPQSDFPGTEQSELLGLRRRHARRAVTISCRRLHARAIDAMLGGAAGGTGRRGEGGGDPRPRPAAAERAGIIVPWWTARFERRGLVAAPLVAKPDGPPANRRRLRSVVGAMIRYLGKRILLLVPTLFGIIAINFAVVQLAPGGPVQTVIAQDEAPVNSGCAKAAAGTRRQPVSRRAGAWTLRRMVTRLKNPVRLRQAAAHPLPADAARLSHAWTSATSFFQSQSSVLSLVCATPARFLFHWACGRR